MAQHQCCWGVIAAPDQEARQNPCPLLHTIWNFHLIWHHWWVTSSTISPPPLLQCKMCSPSICAHSQNICLGCSSGQGGQTSPPCFFWPKISSLTSPHTPFSLLPFFPLTCFHRAGWSWMTIHACCCWIWMCVRERVWEPWHPIIWCLPNRSHTPVNSPGPLQSGFCAIPPSQSCHTSFQPDSTHIHTWSSASLQEISDCLINGHISASMKVTGLLDSEGKLVHNKSMTTYLCNLSDLMGK